MQKKFQILSLDGGGIKGLYSAALLAKLEENLGGISVTEHFDLITGTSTGGIIALGLGLGLRPREIVQFYVAEGPKIFKKKPLWTSLRSYTRSKYPQEPLKLALQKYFEDKLIVDSSKRLVIPSYNLAKDEVYIFKTPHHPRLTTDGKVPMWKVALATSAAPTYFPCCEHVDGMRLVDGGLWANNPTMVGIVEAVSLLKKPLEAISTLSLGTTNSISKKARSIAVAKFIGERWGSTLRSVDKATASRGKPCCYFPKNEQFVWIRLFQMDSLLSTSFAKKIFLQKRRMRHASLRLTLNPPSEATRRKKLHFVNR
ncbi:CBASS cGAMP-activated phospholipase [Pirellulaceae bacterium SH449]